MYQPVPGTTVYDSVNHTDLGRLPVLDNPTLAAVSVSVKKLALQISRRELSEDVRISFGLGTLLVFEQSSLGNGPRRV